MSDFYFFKLPLWAQLTMIFSIIGICAASYIFERRKKKAFEEIIQDLLIPMGLTQHLNGSQVMNKVWALIEKFHGLFQVVRFESVSEVFSKTFNDQDVFLVRGTQVSYSEDFTHSCKFVGVLLSFRGCPGKDFLWNAPVIQVSMKPIIIGVTLFITLFGIFFFLYLGASGPEMRTLFFESILIPGAMIMGLVIFGLKFVPARQKEDLYSELSPEQKIVLNKIERKIRGVSSTKLQGVSSNSESFDVFLELDIYPTESEGRGDRKFLSVLKELLSPV